MHWREPIETIQAREQFWNQPRITASIMLAVTASGVFGGALLGTLAVRILTGDWHWPTAPLLGTIFGGFFGLAFSYPRRVRVSTQEIELRSDDFSMRDDTQERQLRYDQLRGYSLMESLSDGHRLRLLVLYPQAGRALSIGLPENVTDAQIHDYLSDHAPVVTIIDDEALQCPAS